MPNNYSLGKVYKIVCRKTGLQYFGSTTEPTLSRRLAGHNCDIKRWKQGEFGFVSSFSVMEENDYYIELVELVPCSSKDELLVRERFHIQNNECVNKLIPLRTSKEYYEDNKKVYSEKAKENYKINKESINERNNNYNKKNREDINEKTRIKYHEVPVEIRQKKRHEKYEKCKDKINDKNKEKYTCDCGSTLRKSDKSQHEKSIKHQNYLKEILGENAE
jgi:hypothetical protein